MLDNDQKRAILTCNQLFWLIGNVSSSWTLKHTTQIESADRIDTLSKHLMILPVLWHSSTYTHTHTRSLSESSLIRKIVACVRKKHRFAFFSVTRFKALIIEPFSFDRPITCSARQWRLQASRTGGNFFLTDKSWPVVLENQISANPKPLCQKISSPMPSMSSQVRVRPFFQIT